MAVYTLAPEERLVAMMPYAGYVLVATTHRLFEVSVIPIEDGSEEAFVAKPILMEAKDANAED